MIAYTTFSYEFLDLILAFEGENLIFIDRKKDRDRLQEDFPHEKIMRDDTKGHEVKKQLAEYFAKKRQVFTVPFAFKTGTPFQQHVWMVLLKVPHGKTISYSELAKRAGNEKAVRAVATAVGKNPISIIVPCHRILPKDTKKGIGNYGGGVDMKAFLLEVEKPC